MTIEQVASEAALSVGEQYYDWRAMQFFNQATTEAVQ